MGSEGPWRSYVFVGFPFFLVCFSMVFLGFRDPLISHPYGKVCTLLFDLLKPVIEKRRLQVFFGFHRAFLRFVKKSFEKTKKNHRQIQRKIEIPGCSLSLSLSLMLFLLERILLFTRFVTQLTLLYFHAHVKVVSISDR